MTKAMKKGMRWITKAMRRKHRGQNKWQPEVQPHLRCKPT